jgi:hypothetical protein
MMYKRLCLAGSLMCVALALSSQGNAQATTGGASTAGGGVVGTKPAVSPLPVSEGPPARRFTPMTPELSPSLPHSAPARSGSGVVGHPQPTRENVPANDSSDAVLDLDSRLKRKLTICRGC